MRNNVLESKINEILSRGVSEVIDKYHLKNKLLSGKKIRIKLGIDPTSHNIHLGRAVALWKLRDFQDLGHQIVLIIGDFTGQIGDTSDKDAERPMLSEALVKQNMKTYLDQVYKILDPSKVTVRYNSVWLSKLDLGKIGELATFFSLSEFISRDNIKKRLDAGKRVSLREVLYPLMQGYDSVMVDTDLELGGTDQRFNMLAGREIQKYYPPTSKEMKSIKETTGDRRILKRTISKSINIEKNEPQDILMVNLIEGLDGRKMSSSWSNTINLLDDPNTMFGKVMSMGDELIVKYFIHCTRVPMEEVNQTDKDIKSRALNPRNAKIGLAHEIVRMYHSEKEADKAKEYFINTFSKKEIPQDIPELKIKSGMKLTEFLAASGNAKSISDARRKIEQGGVEINGEKIQDWKMTLNKSHDNSVVKIGKFGFAKIKIA